MNKRKRFYNNKKRNQKWTEEPKGKKIEFADKYIENGDSQNKFDSKRTKTVKDRAKRQKRLKNLIIAVLCVVLIGVGYTGMDTYMAIKENAYNQKVNSSDELSNLKDMQLDFRSFKTDSISLDSSVMLSSVINDTATLGFTSITFDAKRSDGTVGYDSSLASVDTFNAVSAPASKPSASIKELLKNDLLPIARISCYKDNVAPKYIPEASIKGSDNKLYKDEDENTYLNPNSDAAYGYLRDIIKELVSMGVTVFVLNDCDLPETISKNYNDGFEAISKKLYKDIGNNIKLLEETDVKITGIDQNNGKITNSAIKEEINKFEKTDKNKVYCIISELETKELITQLNKNNVTNYIIIG